MSELPTLQEVVDAALHDVANMPRTGVTVPAAALHTGVLRADPPQVVCDALLELAHAGEGGRLLIDIPDTRWRKSAGYGVPLIQRTTAWAAGIGAHLVEDSLAIAYNGGELVVLQVAATARGALPGRGELEAVESADDDDLDGAALQSVLRCARVPVPAAGWWGDEERAEAAMLALRIAKGSSFAHEVTLAGVVAFGRQPWRHIAGMRLVVRAGRSWEERGSLPQLLSRIGVSIPLCDGLDAAVVRELLVNALIHRDWSRSARDVPVVVVCSADGVDVSNPGTLGDRSRPAPANPVLYDLVRRRGLTSGAGGLTTLRRNLGRGRGELRLVEGAQEVRAAVQITRSPTRAATATPAPTSRQLDRRMPGCVTASLGTAASSSAQATPRSAELPSAPAPARSADARDDAVCSLLRSSGKLNARQIEQALGWSRSSTRDTLARLVEAGQVRRLASSPRSPDQAYEVLTS